ncbi:MAG: hypothetical protein ABF931_09045 [Acetobacter pasteurianus]
MSNTVKIMSGDLFISQNPRSFYTSVQVLRPDDLPNSNQINIRFEVKWINRKGETKCFSEYKQSIKMWILKNDARRFPNQERPAERTHIIGYVPDQLPWNDFSPPMTGLYRERSPLGRNAVVLEKDHIADVARREVLIADLNLKNAHLHDELTARDAEFEKIKTVVAVLLAGLAECEESGAGLSIEDAADLMEEALVQGGVVERGECDLVSERPEA